MEAVVLVFLFLLFLGVFDDGVARSRVLDLQDHSQGAGRQLHGALARIGGVVAGAHRLIGPALGAEFVAEGAAAPVHLQIPQALLADAAMDVVAGLGFYALSFVG